MTETMRDDIMASLSHEATNLFYAVVLDGLDSIYVFGESDAHAVSQAFELAGASGKSLRLVFVSAHNDPINGLSVMREVFNRDSFRPVCNCDKPQDLHSADCAFQVWVNLFN